MVTVKAQVQSVISNSMAQTKKAVQNTSSPKSGLAPVDRMKVALTEQNISVSESGKAALGHLKQDHLGPLATVVEVAQGKITEALAVANDSKNGSHTAAQRTALGNILTDVYANLDQAVAAVRDFLGERIADNTGLSKEIVFGRDGESFTFNSVDLRTGMPAGQRDAAIFAALTSAEIAAARAATGGLAAFNTASDNIIASAGVPDFANVASLDMARVLVDTPQGNLPAGLDYNALTDGAAADAAGFAGLTEAAIDSLDHGNLVTIFSAVDAAGIGAARAATGGLAAFNVATDNILAALPEGRIKEGGNNAEVNTILADVIAGTQDTAIARVGLGLMSANATNPTTLPIDTVANATTAVTALETALTTLARHAASIAGMKQNVDSKMSELTEKVADNQDSISGLLAPDLTKAAGIMSEMQQVVAFMQSVLLSQTSAANQAARNAGTMLTS